MKHNGFSIPYIKFLSTKSAEDSKEFKIIMITLMVLFFSGLLFFKLSDSIFLLPETIPGALLFMIVLNIIVFGVCIIFSKVTAKKIIVREL